MSRGHSRGYTMIEVMMSLALLGIGASGVIAIQKATLLGNNQARNVATANAVAQGWVERLRAEALQWNAPHGTDDLTTHTVWLALAKTSSPAWFNPMQVLPGGTSPAGSPVADLLGSDIYPNAASQPAFCTKMRLTRLNLFPNPQINDPTTSRTILVEVRVYWERAGQPVNCTDLPDPELLNSSYNRYGFVSLATAVIQNTSLQ